MGVLLVEIDIIMIERISMVAKKSFFALRARMISHAPLSMQKHMVQASVQLVLALVDFLDVATVDDVLYSFYLQTCCQL